MQSQSEATPDFLIKYSRSLSGKVIFFQAYCDDIQKISYEKEELKQALHKIVGSGGMYGFDNLSNAAREIHEKLSSVTDCEKEQSALGKEITELISIINNIVSEHT